MNLTRGAVIFFATLALAASGGDIAGKWKAVVVGGVLHKTIAEATFEFKVDGGHLTGTAHIGNSYPGIAPISDGEINVIASPSPS